MHQLQKRRIKQILAVAAMLFLAIILKLASLQLFSYESLLSKAKDLWQRDFQISGIRGSILSSDQEVLAMDIPSTSVIVVPNMIEDAKYCAQFLANVLNTDEANLYKKITNKVSTQKLQPEGRNISDEQARIISDANLDGVVLVTDSKRYYPKGNYLSQVIGFSGIDNQGLAGLELEYDDLLKANGGDLKITFDAKGHELEVDEELIHSGYGLNLILTIDSTIQSVMEREMNHLMLSYNPKSAWAIAMDPNSGAILGMVSKPDFDPNHYQEATQEVINRNLPIWMSFEPGSTFKAMTFASGLEERKFDMYKDTYYDKGYEMVEGARIKSWRAGGHGLQTFLQVLENSSNPGFVEIGRRLGLDLLVDYVNKFGFGSKTGVDMPGESSGIMFKKEVMGPVEQATVSFGQGISVTAIQLVRAFCAVVNGGTLYQPYITAAIQNPLTQEILYETEKKVIRQVISQETSELMRVALESVVANGGGKNAYIEGYQIGGKTGTAQKVLNGVYQTNEYILSFLSMAPANDPQIVIYVAADSPQNNIQYGGTVVAPVIKKMYEDILPYLNVAKVSDQIPKKTTWLDPIKIKVPNYVGLSQKDCKSSQLELEFIGSADTVIDQYPVADSVIDEFKKVVLILG